MAIRNSPEERQIIKLIQKLSLPESDRQTWVEQIQTSGMTEEMAEQIAQALAQPIVGEAPQSGHSRQVVEFSQLVRHWRLSQGAKHFHKS